MKKILLIVALSVFSFATTTPAVFGCKKSEDIKGVYDIAGTGDTLAIFKYFYEKDCAFSFNPRALKVVKSGLRYSKACTSDKYCRWYENELLN